MFEHRRNLISQCQFEIPKNRNELGNSELYSLNDSEFVLQEIVVTWLGSNQCSVQQEFELTLLL